MNFGRGGQINRLLPTDRLSTATEPSSINNQLLAVGRQNKNIVSKSFRFGRW